MSQWAAHKWSRLSAEWLMAACAQQGTVCAIIAVYGQHSTLLAVLQSLWCNWSIGLMLLK